MKGRAQFENVVQKRNDTHNLFCQIGTWHNNMVDNFHEGRNQITGNIKRAGQEIASRLEHIRKNGLDSEGQMATFNHQMGNSKFSAKIGAHRGKTSNKGWNKSNNHVKATLLESNFKTGGNNWEVEGALNVGDLDASMKHTVLQENIRLQDGWKNGPKGSANAKAEMFNIKAKGSIGTDKDEAIGIRLKGDVAASWGFNAGINADVKEGLGPFNLRGLGLKTHANVKVVIDHKTDGAGRKELASLKVNKGKIDAHVNWKEVGNVLEKQDFRSFTNFLEAGTRGYGTDLMNYG